jgi:hypothetical protein
VFSRWLQPNVASTADSADTVQVAEVQAAVLMDGYRLNIELPGVPPLNSADALHWRKRKKLKDRWLVSIRAAIGQHKPARPLSSALVTITRCTSQPPDGDNLHTASKFILDALVQCRVLEDDRHTVVGMPTVRWEKASPKRSSTRIFVQAVSPSELDLSAWDFKPGDVA